MALPRRRRSCGARVPIAAGRSSLESIELYLSGRYYELLRAALDAFAGDNGVRLVEPFYDPRFALASRAKRLRRVFPSRTAAFEAPLR